jgi:hypothetical protein
VSAGIVHKGPAPTRDASTTISLGSKGDRGLGGKPGQNDGPDGVAQHVYAVP